MLGKPIHDWKLLQSKNVDLIENSYITEVHLGTKKMKFSFKNYLCKCDQIRSYMRIWSHLLKKFSMKNFIFCKVQVLLFVMKLILRPMKIDYWLSVSSCKSKCHMQILFFTFRYFKTKCGNFYCVFYGLIQSETCVNLSN